MDKNSCSTSTLQIRINSCQKKNKHQTEAKKLKFIEFNEHKTACLLQCTSALMLGATVNYNAFCTHRDSCF